MSKPRGFWARAYDDFFGLRTLIYLTLVFFIAGLITHWDWTQVNYSWDTAFGISVFVSLLRAWRSGQPDKRDNGK